MTLTELLDLSVIDDDGNRLGRVIDLQFGLDSDFDERTPQARLVALVISPHTRRSYLGYARSDANTPVIINRIMQWTHRGTFSVPWSSVRVLSRDRVTLRPDYQRLDLH